MPVRSSASGTSSYRVRIVLGGRPLVRVSMVSPPSVPRIRTARYSASPSRSMACPTGSRRSASYSRVHARQLRPGLLREAVGVHPPVRPDLADLVFAQHVRRFRERVGIGVVRHRDVEQVPDGALLSQRPFELAPQDLRRALDRHLVAVHDGGFSARRRPGVHLRDVDAAFRENDPVTRPAGRHVGGTRRHHVGLERAADPVVERVDSGAGRHRQIDVGALAVSPAPGEDGSPPMLHFAGGRWVCRSARSSAGAVLRHRLAAGSGSVSLSIARPRRPREPAPCGSATGIA